MEKIHTHTSGGEPGLSPRAWMGPGRLAHSPLVQKDEGCDAGGDLLAAAAEHTLDGVPHLLGQRL
jgi:hypothetical protein